MKRSILLASTLCALLSVAACERAATAVAGADGPITDAAGKPTTMPAQPSADQLAGYKSVLSPESYRVLFEADTEPPFHNPYFDNHAAGIYVSAATGKPLFSSADKYESGTGWPSFVKPIDASAVVLKTDADGDRTEVIDASSGGHLGHVFDDGPADRGGKRYCMNSAAMKFIPGEATTKPAK